MRAPGEAEPGSPVAMSDARTNREEQDLAAVRALLETVPDPEIPVLSVVDLGIVREVVHGADGAIEVRITPTYSGCPATRLIEQEIRRALDRAGHRGARIRTVLHPPWTTDWLSAQGRAKLRAFGIAPPLAGSGDKRALMADDPPVPCPRCGADDTERVSEFGSTPCKAHHRCKACLEPFDYFKCH